MMAEAAMMAVECPHPFDLRRMAHNKAARVAVEWWRWFDHCCSANPHGGGELSGDCLMDGEWRFI
jgi:hypothetical protein